MARVRLPGLRLTMMRRTWSSYTGSAIRAAETSPGQCQRSDNTAVSSILGTTLNQSHPRKWGDEIVTAEALPTRRYPPVTDLVIAARSGDQQAWDALIERYAPLI